MSLARIPGFAPREVTALLRIEGLVVLVVTLFAYQAVGGNWWLFALLLLVPDLSMLGAFRSPTFGARTYNLVHTYALPVALGLVAWLVRAPTVYPFVLIWIAHIAMDRAVGYGLKYPGLDHHTHLGLTGKARKEAARLANAR